VHIFKTEQDNPQLSKAYTYVGVSKLSCHGCNSFFHAFNLVHGTAFMTKGSHAKSYYPWQFPQAFPGRDAVIRSTYQIIANGWASTYDGYRTKFVPLRADSTAQSGRTLGAPAGDLDEAYFAQLCAEAQEEFEEAGLK